MIKYFRPFIIIGLILLFAGNIWADDPQPNFITTEKPGKIIQDIRVSKDSFNPSKGEEWGIYYQLNSKAKVNISLYDPDQELVAVLINQKPQGKGKKSVLWDGKDIDGQIVPDEAYFFTIEAVDQKGNMEIYDPTIFSGGEEDDITQGSIDSENGTINYRLPEMGRVSIRLGISGGPLLRTLVDWKPRLTGEVTEYWNGKDQDNLFDLQSHPRFKMLITYFSLPENSIIAYGNKKLGYFEYKTGQKNRPKKRDYPGIEIGEREISKHYAMPRLMDRSPRVVMTFPKSVRLEEDNLPVLKGKTIVHVELDKESKKYFQEMKFEIVFFLDGEFYAEEETGYSPYNWIWDTSQIKEGTYILTVNLASFKDQVGLLSKKVKIVR